MPSMNWTNFTDVLMVATTVLGSLGLLLMVAGGVAATILDGDETSEPQPPARASLTAPPTPTTGDQPRGPLVSRGILQPS